MFSTKGRETNAYDIVTDALLYDSVTASEQKNSLKYWINTNFKLNNSKH